MNKILLVLTLALTLSVCANKTFNTQADSKPPVSGVTLDNFSTTIRPQDNFYHYVNGKWLDEFDLPADKAYYGTSGILKEQIQGQIKTIINEVSEINHQQGSAEQKIADIYRAYMDLDAIEAKGISSLEADFKKIDDIANISDLSEYMGYADVFSKAPFWFFVYLDDKNSDEYIIFMEQSGLGLPDRDYYLKGGIL